MEINFEVIKRDIKNYIDKEITEKTTNKIFIVLRRVEDKVQIRERDTNLALSDCYQYLSLQDLKTRFNLS
jgi:hypothetical protein